MTSQGDHVWLKKLFAQTSRTTLLRLYRQIEAGGMGGGAKVATLRRELLDRLNGPRRQHARRLFQNAFQAFLAEEDYLLCADSRPPWLVHRAEMDPLWAGLEHRILPELAPYATHAIAAAAAEQPLDDVLTGELARGLEQQIQSAAATGLRRLKARQREQLARTVGENRTRGARRRPYPGSRPGSAYTETLAAMVESGPLLTPAARRLAEAAEHHDDAGLGAAIVAEAGNAEATCTAMRWPPERAAMVALLAVYRCQRPDALAQVTAELPNRVRSHAYEAICLYYQGVSRAFNDDMLALLDGDPALGSAAAAFQRIEREHGQLTAAGQALHHLPPRWQALGLTRSLVESAAQAFGLLRNVLPQPLKDQTETVIRDQVQRYSEAILPRIDAHLGTTLSAASDPEGSPSELPALQWLLSLSMSLRHSSSLPASARRPLVRWQQHLDTAFADTWEAILAQPALTPSQRADRLGRVMALAATCRFSPDRYIQVTDDRLISVGDRALLSATPLTPAGRTLVASLTEAAEAELARNPAYHDPGLQEFLTSAQEAGLTRG